VQDEVPDLVCYRKVLSPIRIVRPNPNFNFATFCDEHAGNARISKVESRERDSHSKGEVKGIPLRLRSEVFEYQALRLLLNFAAVTKGDFSSRCIHNDHLVPTRLCRQTRE